MDRKPSTLLVFFMLLAFTGQLLAAPLLGCHQFDQVAMDEPDCHSMGMTPAKEMGAMEKPVHQQDHDGMSADTGMGSCEQLCFHCPSGASPRQAKVILPAPTLELPVSDAFIPSFHLKGLFRPPIFA